MNIGVAEMSEDKHQNQHDPEGVSRRDLVRKGAKAAYVVPLVLAVVTAAERPSYAGTNAPT